MVWLVLQNSRSTVIFSQPFEEIIGCDFHRRQSPCHSFLGLSLLLAAVKVFFLFLIFCGFTLPPGVAFYFSCLGFLVLPSFSCRKFSIIVEIFLFLIFSVLYVQVSCVLGQLVLSLALSTAHSYFPPLLSVAF